MAVRVCDIDLPQAVLLIAGEFGVVTGGRQLALDLRHHLLLAKDLAEPDLVFGQYAVAPGKRLEQQRHKSRIVVNAACEPGRVVSELRRSVREPLRARGPSTGRASELICESPVAIRIR